MRYRLALDRAPRESNREARRSSLRWGLVAFHASTGI
jgi:hypothetical protein